MSALNDSKLSSLRDFIHKYITPFFTDERLKERQEMAIIDAVQYVEQLNTYGRGGHLQDMTIYGLFNALKEALVLNSKLSMQVWDLTGAREALDQNLALIKYKDEKLGAIKELVDEYDTGEPLFKKLTAILNGVNS